MQAWSLEKFNKTSHDDGFFAAVRLHYKVARTSGVRHSGSSGKVGTLASSDEGLEMTKNSGNKYNHYTGDFRCEVVCS